MVDKSEPVQEKKHFEEDALKVVASLQKKKINAWYVPSRKEALVLVLGMIPEGVVVGRGDSISVEQVGVVAELKRRDQNRLIDPTERDASGQHVLEQQARRRQQRECFSADVYLTGTNAITLDGKLVNVDGLGNRVAAMVFGPEKVIVVAGVNKIVKDEAAALERIRNVAAPLNVKRHYLEHHEESFGRLPCLKTGKCANCRGDWSICHYKVIIDGAMARQKGRINVVLVGESLGL